MIVLVALLGAGEAAAAGAPKEIVREIVIDGAHRIDPATIRHRLTFHEGEAYDPAETDRSLKALYATGEFADVRIAGTGRKIVVTVVENPVVAAIAFSGNREIASDKLKPLLALKPGAPYSRSRGELDAHRIRDFYRKEGRHQSAVTIAAKPAGDGRVDLAFEIVESPVNKVGRIEFAGAAAIPASELEGVVATSVSGTFDFLKSTVAYEPERVALDRELIRRYYLKKGYADVIVHEPEATLAAETGSYVIRHRIEEGEVYQFGVRDVAVAVAGVDRTALLSLLPPAGRFDGSEIDRTVERMSAALLKAGHPFARVRAELRRDGQRHAMGVVFRVEDGPHLYVERIDIRGNTRTSHLVIRRELKMAEGDPFSMALVEKARKRLMGTGFFKSVDVAAEPRRDSDRVAVTVTVAEGDTGELSFGVGYSTSEGVVGDVSYAERNLLGNGQYLKLKLAGSLTRLDAEVSFTEPHFLGSDVSAGGDLFYKDLDRTAQSSFKSQRIGATGRLGFPITDEITTGLSYTFSRNTIYDVGPQASLVIKDAVPGFPDKTSTTYYTSAVGTTVSYDTRDNRKSPTEGIYLASGQEVAGLGGDVNYLRTTGDARGYMALGSGFVLAGRVTGGTIGGWGGQDVRLLDMFYRGNDLVRGFAPSGIGPRDLGSVNQDALGGRSYYGTSAELRFPLPYVPEDLGLRGAVFADAGSLFGTSARANRLATLGGNSAAPRMSVGGELVWDSPVGALRLDYAKPLVAQPGDKTQPFSFGIGPSF